MKKLLYVGVILREERSTENIFPISTGNLESQTAEMSFSHNEPMSTEGKRTKIPTKFQDWG
jgi:hypothetical protein